MKKVVWISDFPLRGSSFGSCTLDLLSRMPQDYSFDVLSLGYNGMPLKITENIRVFELEDGGQLNYYFKKLKPDISVVFHSYWMLDSLMPYVNYITGKRILYLPVEGEEIPTAYEKCFSSFDAVTTPSEYCKKVLKKGGINASVVPHGVDTEFFKPKKKEWSEFTYGYFGLNDIRKQVPRVMEAFSKLEGKGVLEISANNKGHYDLLELAKKYKVSPVFLETKLRGLTLNKEAIREWYQSLDVYISPATEGFGVPALEAQACGIPTIALDSGAAREVLGNGAVYCNVADQLETSVGKVGLVSTDDLYRKMRFMMQVKDAYEKTAKKALSNAKKWTWENAVKKMIEVFEQ